MIPQLAFSPLGWRESLRQQFRWRSLFWALTQRFAQQLVTVGYDYAF